MQKNYSKKNLLSPSLNPKNQTIEFLLNYSRSLCIIDLNFKKVEINLN